jgi:hypothetical protein
MFAGGVVTTPCIAFLNWRATDGPYSPQRLVALAILSALAVMLLPFQMVAFVIHNRDGGLTLRGASWIGVPGEIVADAPFARRALIDWHGGLVCLGPAGNEGRSILAGMAERMMQNLLRRS